MGFIYIDEILILENISILVIKKGKYKYFKNININRIF